MPDSLFQSPQLEYASGDAAAGSRQSFSKLQKTQFQKSPTSEMKKLKNRIYRKNVTLTDNKLFAQNIAEHMSSFAYRMLFSEYLH
jgi:hypothetical protein